MIVGWVIVELPNGFEQWAKVDGDGVIEGERGGGRG